jgi:hypothetical protein
VLSQNHESINVSVLEGTKPPKGQGLSQKRESINESVQEGMKPPKGYRLKKLIEA